MPSGERANDYFLIEFEQTSPASADTSDRSRKASLPAIRHNSNNNNAADVLAVRAQTNVLLQGVFFKVLDGSGNVKQWSENVA